MDCPNLTPPTPAEEACVVGRGLNDGLRFNEGKRRFDLIPPDAMAALADLFTIGARKYAERNWERGMAYSKVIASLDRHWNDFKAGIDRDPETGCLHITHVVWNAMALLTFKLRGIGVDDRQKVPMPEQVTGPENFG